MKQENFPIKIWNVPGGLRPTPFEIGMTKIKLSRNYISPEKGGKTQVNMIIDSKFPKFNKKFPLLGKQK